MAKPTAATAPASPPGSTDLPQEHRPVHHERVVIIPTRTYWVCLGLSLVCLALTVGFYEEYLPIASLGFYWGTIVLALIVITWCVFGLLRRGRVVHNTVYGTKAFTGAIADSMRNRSEAHEGAVGRFADKWARRFAAVINTVKRFALFLVRVVKLLLRLPMAILIWAYYTTEKLVLRIFLILYDILYYPLYAAWRVAIWAWVTSWKIVWWGLRVVWKIIKFPTKLPLLRGLWAEKMRPPILAMADGRVEAWNNIWAKRVAKGRHMAELREQDPDQWERDYHQRKGFPLPHPEHGRVAMRKRIAHVKDVQQARREKRPVPKWESPAAKLRDKRREARKKAKEEELAEQKREAEERKRAKEEKKAAKKAKKGKDDEDAEEAPAPAPAPAAAADPKPSKKGLSVVGKGKEPAPEA